MTKNVLITGMSGLIGRATRTALEGEFNLRALNRSDVPGVETVRADLASYADIRPAFDGQDTVVHLAAKAGNHYTWDEFRDTNVIGTRNVFEAASDAGVKRVIFASSGATISAWEKEEPYASLVAGRYEQVPASWTMITHQMATRPNGVYGGTKVWGESLARHYVDSAGLSAICLRIGFVNAEDRPSQTRHYSVWCSQRDIVQMIGRALRAPVELRFDTFFVVSNNKWGYRDLTHPREVLGFVPQDAAEDFRD